VTNALLPAYVNATDSSGQPAFRYHEVLPVSSEVIARQGSIAEFFSYQSHEQSFLYHQKVETSRAGFDDN
jgi:hypothetical protein